MNYLQLLITSIFLSFSIVALGQSLSGTLTDKATGEPLIGANILAGTQGTTSDLDGQYKIELSPGAYEVTFSYVGYETVSQSVTIGDDDLTIDIALSQAGVLKEVIVTADIAIERKTPVAFSNVPTIKLKEELAGQDLPMILNSTPGAYATQSGGGDGDARVTIRGFNQRNLAVMLDGIPVNDMENGWVFWSNWFGLDLVTKTMQVQRGLGASKLAIPSVGGTINILTKGVEAKQSFRIKQEVGNNGFIRSTLGYTSGRLENGWGISAAGSYKQGDGWVDATYTEGYFYYLRIDKEIGKHLISLSGFGAPQEHGQRSFQSPAATFDTDFAQNELGIQTADFPQTGTNFGLRYNQHAGIRNGEIINTRRNFYHKPQISLRHSWNPSDNFYLSNVAYVSIGTGGGVRTRGSLFGNDDRLENGLLDLDEVYRQNTEVTLFNPDSTAENILFASHNEHFWYGLLSTAQYQINENLKISGGIDLRDYEGLHYRKIHDLLGGNSYNQAALEVAPGVFIDQSDLVVGDTIDYNYTSGVRWAGLFGLIEYEKNGISTFLNLSTGTTGYNIIDHFSGASLDWLWRPSFTAKTGASFNLNDANSVFFNTGYLSRPTRFNNVIQNNVFNVNAPRFIDDPTNEIVYAFELGYSYKSSIFSGNLNGYYTVWDNRPLDNLPTVSEDPADPEANRIPVNVSGLAALHKGIELDFALKITPEITFEGLASIGDWIWNSGDTVILPDGITTYEFDATGVHVGDAAQIQYGGLIRYEPIKGLYFKLKATHFAKNYSNFSPEDLRGATARVDSWIMPSYTLFDFHAGYRFNINKTRVSWRVNVLNLLDTTYISDARNNDRFTQTFNDFDARSASVFFGQGLRWNTSVSVSF